MDSASKAQGLVIYHGPTCRDGFAAAWCVHHLTPVGWRRDDTAMDIDFHPGVYGDPPPDVTGRDVLLVDFSYPRTVLERMHAEARSLVVLDHHKTAQADLEGLDYCVFDMNRSGAQIAWDYLGGGDDRPPIIDYVADRDLWRWAMYGSRQINAAIWSWPLTFEAWDGLMEIAPATLERDGAAILRYQQTVAAEIAAQAKRVQLAGYDVPAVNAECLRAEVGEILRQAEPFAVVYWDRGDGRRQYMLVSADDGVDVSAIAKGQGGGGHAHAAGFEAPAPPVLANVR